MPAYRRPLLALISCTTLLAAVTAHADAASADATSKARADVTALADRYVAEFRVRFPISYSFAGLPVERHDGVDINAPADFARWREFEKGLARELKSIDPGAFAGTPEWVTWQFLNQTMSQSSATEICHAELWSVSAFGWQAGLSQLVNIQPVGTPQEREQALARWNRIGAWIDQEIANLEEGQRRGYSATQATVQATLGQLDNLLAGSADKSPYMEPTGREKSPDFVSAWTGVVQTSVWPGLTRYRNFLRDEYLPRARTAVSIEKHPDGRACYRALIFSTVTIDADPLQLFEIATQKVERERARAVELGRKLYGDKARDWNALAALMKADPKNKFATAEEVRDYTQRTYEKANAAAAKMVLTPPAGKVVLQPFPEHAQASSPGGQYLAAAEDGSRPATYFYRNVPTDLYRGSLQNVIFHETLPGHHLQSALLSEHGPKENHPIARLLFFSGPGEGWATYSEDFAREIGLYDSDLDYIGGLMGSIAPMMVVDLGMQVKGWSVDQAVAYLREAMPMRPPERAPQSVATISGLPGLPLAYPLGGMQWEKMRARAEKALGPRFDVRAFHQVLLEDGMLPFAALESKLDRWIAAGGKAGAAMP